MSVNGHVMDVRIQLNKDQSFESIFEYTDGAYDTINIDGSFKWDNTGNIILIDVIDAPTQYKVAENMLIRLDTYNYVLKKIH